MPIHRENPFYLYPLYLPNLIIVEYPFSIFSMTIQLQTINLSLKFQKKEYCTSIHAGILITRIV